MVVTDEPVIGGSPPVATLEQCAAYFLGNDARKVGDADVAEIVNAAWEYGGRVGIRADLLLSQLAHETNVLAFGGDVTPDQHNPAGIGTTGGGVKGLTFPHWDAGLVAMLVHLLTWCGRDDLTFLIATAPSSLDPRVPLVQQARAAKGAATTWASLAGRWAVPGDGYAAGIARHYAAMLAITQEATSMSIPKPPMTKRPSPNHGYSGDYLPQAVVWHISEGDEASGVSWLTNPASLVSSNYLVGRTGIVYELVDPEAGQQGAAWANGIPNKPDRTNPLIDGWIGSGMNPNRRTVSIECAGMSSHWQGGSLTAPQIDALVQLTAWVCQRFGIAPDRAHILRHQQINDVDKHDCPGFSIAEMDAWVARVGALAGGTPATPVPFKHAPGFIGPPLVVNLNYGGDTAGIITKVITEVYNDESKHSYRLTWTPGGQTIEDITP